MQPLIDAAIEHYTAEHTKEPNELMRELTKVTHERMASPDMQVGAVEGAFLRLLVAMMGARRVLEVGTFTGYSALCMAEALPEGGKVITCDIDPVATGIARSFFDRSPHKNKIEIRLGPALETMSAMPKGEPFDLVFLDADKAAYVEYYEKAVGLVRHGGLIVADNTLWSGRVLDPKTDDDRGIDAFNKLVTKDPRVDSVLLPVRDGIMIARKL